MKNTIKLEDHVCLTVCGEAGQGMDTVTNILARTFKNCGYNIFSTSEFMSRIRGGCNSNDLRISSERINANSNKIDIFIPLSNQSMKHVKHRLSKDTIVFGEKDYFDEELSLLCQMIEINFTELARESGGKIYSNTVSAGLIAGLFKIDFQMLEKTLKSRFSNKSDEIINNNLNAARKGYDIGIKLIESEKISINIKDNESIKEDIILTGTEAVSLGCIAGGCQFISTYPMSPSTGVLIFLAGQSKEFDIIVEQAEDEIAGINMALGASYAGGRAMVTTSGGGFALMEEGISLSGMTETPIVIHLAQRPGPATGLPTRTGQEDLELALYSGHGEFPRIIYTPGTLEDAFKLSHKAFNIADEFQVPVFILTDQYLLDSYYNIPELDTSKLINNQHIIKTDENYQRYYLNDSGISPRGIPGHGDGLVCCDSDEHDEGGHITEDLELRVKMVEKRLKKYNLIKEKTIEPELIGPENYEKLIVCWGSTYNIVKEALVSLKNDHTAALYFKQVWPLHKNTIKYLEKASKTIIIESNATSQFSKLIKQETGHIFDHKILKYNGIAFTVEEIVNELNLNLKEVIYGY